MNKKIAAMGCALAVMIASLGGCSLAKEDAGLQGEDRLVGLLITTEYIDTLDYGAYISDNAASIGPDGQLTINGSTEEYTGRIYAAKAENAPDSGDVNNNYVFPGIDGIRYFTVNVTDESGNYQASVGDEGISDGHVSIKTTDNEDSIGLEGTLYVTPQVGEKVFYLNPVYQSTDGSVYVMPGSGFGGSGVSGGGVNSSSTMDYHSTATENGVTTAYSCSITISFTSMNTPKKLVFLEMSKDNTVLSREEYEPGSAPQTITPQLDTAYILAEIYGTDPDGKEQISRTLYDTKATMITSYHVDKNGICIPQFTELSWPEDEGSNA